MIKEFHNLDEIQKYYDEKSNTYVFREDGKAIDLVVFNFDLYVDANIYCNDIIANGIDVINIDACSIKAWDIEANDIDAYNIECYDIVANNINAYNINAKDIEADDIVTTRDIKAWHIYAKNIKANNIEAWAIHANDISYWAVCFAIYDIECKSIKGRRENTKHFVLDGTLEVKNDERI